MKTFYFLHTLERPDFEYFLDKVSSIQEIEDITLIIQRFVHKIGENNEGRIHKTAFMEALVFLEVFLQKGLGTIQDIEWVFIKNFLIYNESLYEFRDGIYQEIQEKVRFVTSRDSWKNPFFLFLSKHFSQRVLLIKPNFQIIDSGTDKLSCISRLWDFRREYIGDIIIPYLCNKHISQLEFLFDFVISRLGNHVMIKNNFGVEGGKVRALNLDTNSHEIHELYESVKQDFFDIGTTTQNNPYFTKYYYILREYRIYYTYSQTGKIQIYSIKNRENFPKEEKNIFEKKDFTRENFEIIWSYMHPDIFKASHKDIYEVALKLIPHLRAEVGVLELCQERDGNIRFIELNFLGGSLLYSGADEKLMQEYYANMWNLAFENQR